MILLLGEMLSIGQADRFVATVLQRLVELRMCSRQYLDQLRIRLSNAQQTESDVFHDDYLEVSFGNRAQIERASSRDDSALRTLRARLRVERLGPKGKTLNDATSDDAADALIEKCIDQVESDYVSKEVEIRDLTELRLMCTEYERRTNNYFNSYWRKHGALASGKRSSIQNRVRDRARSFFRRRLVRLDSAKIAGDVSNADSSRHVPDLDVPKNAIEALNVSFRSSTWSNDAQVIESEPPGQNGIDEGANVAEFRQAVYGSFDRLIRNIAEATGVLHWDPRSTVDCLGRTALAELARSSQERFSNAKSVIFDVIAYIESKPLKRASSAQLSRASAAVKQLRDIAIQVSDSAYESSTTVASTMRRLSRVIEDAETANKKLPTKGGTSESPAARKSARSQAATSLVSMLKSCVDDIGELLSRLNSRVDNMRDAYSAYAEFLFGAGEVPVEQQLSAASSFLQQAWRDSGVPLALEIEHVISTAADSGLTLTQLERYCVASLDALVCDSLDLERDSARRVSVTISQYFVDIKSAEARSRYLGLLLLDLVDGDRDIAGVTRAAVLDTLSSLLPT